MSDVLTDSFAGVTVPESPLVDRAIQYARQKCEPYVFNMSESVNGIDLS
jgi:hypothetical protein